MSDWGLLALWFCAGAGFGALVVTVVHAWRLWVWSKKTWR